MTIAWLGVALLAFTTAATCWSIPQRALGAELSDDPHVRSRIFGTAYMAALTGAALSFGGMQIVANAADPRTAAIVLASAVAVGMAVLLLIPPLALRERPEHQGRGAAHPIHIEDQVATKRCGHRPGKALVDTGEMVDRIKAAVDGRTDSNFVIMARTDAHAVEGQQAALDRAASYVEAGADMIFAEALTTAEEYMQITSAIDVPVLANLTEFGKTPLFTTKEMSDAGVRLTLYPLSAFRAMSAAAENVYKVLRKEGTQEGVIDTMQTREALYEVLGYHEYEEKLDELFADSGIVSKGKE